MKSRRPAKKEPTPTTCPIDAMKFLKNYTSSVPVSQTIARIEAVLISCEVSGITKDYGPSGKILAIRFHLDMDGKTVTIRLPANEDAAQDALWQNYEETHKDMSQWDKRRKEREDFRDQAERTAWKIVQDWVEVQLSMIATRQAEFVQVFMPYVWDGKQTYFEAVRANHYKALLPENSET